MLNFTPCVATDVGDISNILDGVGLVVPIGDSMSCQCFKRKFKSFDE